MAQDKVTVPDTRITSVEKDSQTDQKDSARALKQYKDSKN